MKRKGTACQGNVYSGPTAVRMLLCVAALGSPRWGSCERSNLCRKHRVQSGKEDPQAGRLGRGLALAWQHIEKGTPRLGEFIREFEPLVGRPRPLCLLLIGPVRIDLGTRHSLPQRCVNNRRSAWEEPNHAGTSAWQAPATCGKARLPRSPITWLFERVFHHAPRTIGSPTPYGSAPRREGGLHGANCPFRGRGTAAGIGTDWYGNRGSSANMPGLRREVRSHRGQVRPYDEDEANKILELLTLARRRIGWPRAAPAPTA